MIVRALGACGGRCSVVIPPPWRQTPFQYSLSPAGTVNKARERRPGACKDDGARQTRDGVPREVCRWPRRDRSPTAELHWLRPESCSGDRRPWPRTQRDPMPGRLASAHESIAQKWCICDRHGMARGLLSARRWPAGILVVMVKPHCRSWLLYAGSATVVAPSGSLAVYPARPLARAGADRMEGCSCRG